MNELTEKWSFEKKLNPSKNTEGEKKTSEDLLTLWSHQFHMEYNKYTQIADVTINAIRQ